MAENNGVENWWLEKLDADVDIVLRVDRDVFW